MFQSHDQQQRIYAGWVSGTDDAAVATALQQAFVNAGFTATKPETRATATRFDFSGAKTGTAIIAVLCQDHLRVYYQLGTSAQLQSQ